MKFVILLASVALAALIGPSQATTVGDHSTATGNFCYRDAEGCGPSKWAAVCHTGKRQSPININPLFAPWKLGTAVLKFNAYKGSSFRMQNNGHSVSIDFGNRGPSTQLLKIADPLKILGPYTTLQGERQYRFAAAHFHWGVTDWTTGSEHCIAGICSAMELHLVHYLANYPSMAAAVASGDPNALAVIGVLINVSPIKTAADVLMAGGTLGPIVRNLHRVTKADHDTSKWITVNEPLDFSAWLATTAVGGMYTYKGSLTTPGCNEQVNWFVLKHRATTSHQDLEAFRKYIKDAEGKALTENHRPLQQQGTREVLFAKIIADPMP